MPNISVGLLRF